VWDERRKGKKVEGDVFVLFMSSMLAQSGMKATIDRQTQ
jgi:hypothetical protein